MRQTDNLVKYQKALAAYKSAKGSITLQTAAKEAGVSPHSFNNWYYTYGKRGKTVPTIIDPPAAPKFRSDEVGIRYSNGKRTMIRRPYRRKPAVETIAVPESTDRLIALIGSHKAVMEAVRSFQ